jgi:RHS repeat-associated protein
MSGRKLRLNPSGSARASRKGTLLVALLVMSATLVAGSGVVRAATRHSRDLVPRAATPPTGIAVAPNALIALQQARASQRPVIIKDQTTKTTTVFANPNQTMTATVGDGPVQEPDSNSPTGFSPIDLKLGEEISGWWSPRRSDAHVEFSDGVGATAVDMAIAKHTFAMKWAGPLPKPVISGDTATYNDVSPGVNLVLQALTSGYDLRIVLTKQPAAATTFRLPLALGGLAASLDSRGGLTLKNNGKVVAAAQQPLMYDATTDEAGDPANVVPFSPSLDSKGALVVTPKDSFLSAPTTKYPVTIDPAVNLSATIDTFVNSASPTTTYAGSTLLKAGKSSAEGPDRSLLQFGTTFLEGSDIFSASLNLYESSAPSCTANGLQVWDVSSTWGSSVNWNTQPAMSAEWASGNTNAGGGTGCPASYVSLSTGGSGSNTLTTLVQDWALGTKTNDGLMVVASNETSTSYFKKFSSNEAGSNAPYLAVNYDFGPGVSGGRLPNDGAFVPTTRPTLQGTFFDLDAGTVGQIQYELDTSGGTVIDTQLGSSVPSGSTSSWQVPAADGLVNGTTYKWRARGYDGILYGLWTGYRTFTVDTTAPGTPVITSSTHPDPAQWYSATSFSASWPAVSDSTSGVAGYAVKVDQNLGTIPSGALQTALTYSKTVGYSGIWYLHVRAEDNAGNWGSTATFEFNVGTGGVLGPAKGDRTQQYFTLQAAAQSTATGATFQYRRGQLDSWTNIPVGDVVDTDNGNASITWPVSFFGTGHTTHHLRWDAKSTLGSVDGPILVRATFSGGSGGSADPVQVALDLHFFDQSSSADGSSFAPVGPGDVNLVTGDFTVSESDATIGAFTVDRSFDSTTPTAQSGGVFGPGWSSSLNLGTYQYLHSGADSAQGTFATVYGSDDTEYDFYSNTSSPTYLTLPDNGGMALVQCTGSGTPSSGCQTSSTFLLTEQDGTQTTFTKPVGGAEYYPTSVVAPNSGSPAGATTAITYSVVGGVTRPTQEVAPAPSGVDCSSSPLTTRGCQTFSFTYATSTTATSTCSSTFGDYNTRLKSVSFTAWNPSGSQMTTTAVAGYSYDSTGQLRATCDPRISPVLSTSYSYDGTGRLSSVAAPGLNSWTLSYDSSSRLTSATRANDPSGTQTTSVIYNVPLSGSGAPYDLSASTAATWGQQDDPIEATAVFPSSEIPSGNPPADYNYATVYYMDENGNEVDVAKPGGNISTSEYDTNGNLIRTLTAQNRASALASNDSVSYALSHDTESGFDATGTELLRQLGPSHQVMLSSGTVVTARTDTQYSYDEGAPSGGPFYLATTRTVGALVDGSTSDSDLRTTTYGYAGQSNLGWTLRAPTTVTVDPGTGHLAVTTTTKYDTLGRVIARILPGNPSGGDAHETDLTYYRAGTGSGVAACDSRPEWDGLVCQTAPAAQPGTAGYPAIPTTTVTYDAWRNQSAITKVSGANTQTTSYVYDGAGRLSTRAATGPGASVPTATYSYSSTTGLPTTIAVTGQTVTHAYDQDGRLKTYTDADGNQTGYTYDTSNRPVTINDGKGTSTLSYDQSGEKRGLLTGVTDSQAGSFAFTYDADSHVATETYPNGMTATVTHDSTGQSISVAYVKTTNCSSACTWFADQIVPTIDGQWSSQSSALSAQSYTYDAAGRLQWVYDTVAGQCATRQYAYDADSNRTALTTRAPNSDGTCNTTAAGTVQSSSYDAADRATNTGYSFDAMDRISAVPAGDAGGSILTTGYYANDVVNTLAQSGVTDTASLDPTWRVRQWATSADSTATKTLHYGDDSDSPKWTAENTSGTSWTRNITAATGLTAMADQSGTVTLELSDLHGDVVATASSSSTATSLTGTFEQTEFGIPRTGQAPMRYGWLGSFERPVDSATGTIIMGVRVYLPTAGRFEQTDPVYGGSANAYDYASQDPIDNTDISGQWYTWCHFLTWDPHCGIQFGHPGTLKIAAGGAIAAGFIALVGAPWSEPIAGALGILSGIADYYAAEGRCLQIVVYATSLNFTGLPLHVSSFKNQNGQCR